MALKENCMKGIFAAVLLAMLVSGCNTVQGVGKDLKQGGEAIERSATKK
jgi:predicted small secreted protein